MSNVLGDYGQYSIPPYTAAEMNGHFHQVAQYLESISSGNANIQRTGMEWKSAQNAVVIQGGAAGLVDYNAALTNAWTPSVPVKARHAVISAQRHLALAHIGLTLVRRTWARCWRWILAVAGLDVAYHLHLVHFG